jgi:sugar lactone lactonase YvrE/CheY-like chemotaxis protein
MDDETSLRVVVVSADRRVHAALAQLLHAASGFSVAEGTGVDAALVDVDPGDQFAAANAIATIHRLVATDIPVLALAGHATRHAEALSAGASACVDKARQPEAILSTLRYVVARARHGTGLMITTRDSGTLLTDQLRYPESPRWHDGLLWLSDVHDHGVKTVDADGAVRRVVDVPGRPAGLGFLPDGTLLVASAVDRRLSIWNGSRLRTVVQLDPATFGPLNDMVVDQDGRAYVGAVGFNLMAGQPPAPGHVVLVDLHDAAPRPRIVADDVMFPNGAAISADGRSYWVADSGAHSVDRFTIGDDGSLTRGISRIALPDLPDGICLDAAGGLWVALLRLGEFWHVDADGHHDEIIRTEGRLAVACHLGGPDRDQLFLCSAATTMTALARGESRGLVHQRPVATPGTGRP